MAAFSATTNPYGALTLSVQVMGAGATETQLAANAVIVGVIDEFNRGRLYNPVASGLAVQSGDAANKWLPSVVSVTPFTAPDGSGQVGQYQIALQPGSADTVNVASVQTMKVDRGALVIVATGTF